MITIIYDDETTTFNARQEVLDRLQQATLPTDVNPGSGPDYSPTGQIMFYTLTSTNPKYDVMELKTLQRLVRAEPVEIGAQRGGREHLWRADPRIPGTDRSRANWFPTGFHSARLSRPWLPTTPMLAEASSSAASRH